MVLGGGYPKFPMTTGIMSFTGDDFGFQPNHQALGFQKHVFGFIGHTMVLALPRKKLGGILGVDDEVREV